MAYTQLAYYYDDVMIDAPYGEWVNFTQKILKTYDIDVQTIVDLGCGTGEITLELAKLGYEMIGIDYSAHMLAVADQKTDTLRQSIQWMKQDLRQLKGLSNQDVMISYCDVINYIITEEELYATFKNVYNSLNNDGLFIFDVHSLSYAKTHLMNHTFADVYDHFSYIWFCHEGDIVGEMFHEIICFAKNDDKTFNRFIEVHNQRTFPENTYIDILTQCGFQKVDVYYDFSIETKTTNKHANRIFFVVTK